MLELSLWLVKQAAEMEVGDVRSIDDGRRIYTQSDRNHFGDVLTGGAFSLGLLEVSLKAAFATGGQRRRDGDVFLGLQVETSLPVSRLVEAHVELLQLWRQHGIATHV